ncbi:MAG: nuclear transport factor 2 family protein [Flavobacteriales bacterium]|nr:nuclear transport factor 2 family protein [Flavobacteriales bacterium]MBP9079179.1 nuclear transport factor 2 family protein [Flavobacteriales bacterium]
MLLERFYSALARHDWATMGALYAQDARFSDPVFPGLHAAQVKAMWKMLLEGGTDLRLAFKVLEEGPTHGVCTWEAFYTFGSTGRKVHNTIRSEFELRDGLIVRQRDRFNLWRWTRQALGPTGLLLGWTPMVHGKVRTMAAKRLAKAMQG